MSFELILITIFRSIEKILIYIAKSFVDYLKKIYKICTGRIAFFIYGFISMLFLSGLYLDEYNKVLKTNMQNYGMDNITIHKIFTEETRKNAN